MQRSILLASALVSVAFAGTEDIRALIQQKLNLEVQTESLTNAIACPPQGSDLYCPLTTVPNGEFSVDGGTVSSIAAACCPAKYLQCQVQQRSQYCRELLTYEIPESEGLNQDLCPATTPDCTCQTAFSQRKDINLRFCPTKEPCCPLCECHGDPHCHSFSGDTKIWATCDDRDATCVHNAGTCANTQYAGQQCKWVPASTGQVGYCARADGTKIPEMLMYAKTYKKYFEPSDNNVYNFRLKLTLGTYGSITMIEMTDTGKSAQTFKWEIDAAGNCVANPTYPINANGMVIINDLPSMVSLDFQCNPAKGRSPTSGRFDVRKVMDPWFVGSGQILSEQFGGFCATGQISEALLEGVGGGCNTVDRQISKYFGCSGNTDLSRCRANWCRAGNNAERMDFSAIGGSSNVSPVPVHARRVACVNFLNSRTEVKNWLRTVCSMAPHISLGAFVINPMACDENSDCKKCMDDLLDFPEEIETILRGPAITAAPTKVCVNLLERGLERKTLIAQASGVVVEYQSAPNVWTGVFALLDEEIEQCDCPTIFINGTSSSNLALVNPGKYRIRQCNGLDTDRNQELCTSSPAYNTTVTYVAPGGGAAIVSTPYGQLYDQNKLVCNRQLYPGCPPDYPCCVWEDSKAGWTQCMTDSYGASFSTKFPNCKFV